MLKLIYCPASTNLRLVGSAICKIAEENSKIYCFEATLTLGREQHANGLIAMCGKLDAIMKKQKVLIMKFPFQLNFLLAISIPTSNNKLILLTPKKKGILT